MPSSEGASLEVNIEDVAATRALLKQLGPDILKSLDRELTTVARQLKSAAESNFARTGASGSAYMIRTSNRAGSFTKGVTSRGGSVARGQRWSDQPGVLAAVFEFADGISKARPQNVARTRAMLATVTARYGRPGRFLWEAWDGMSSGALARVHGAVEAAENDLTERLA